MFMRRMIKEGELFKLDNRSPRDQQPHNTTQVQPSEQSFDEHQYRIHQRRRSEFPELNVEELAMKNSTVVVVCGAIVCCLCGLIAAAIFYFFLLDYVKPYIPDAAYDYIPFIQRPIQPLYLTQLNAKQYFAQNQLIAGQFHYVRVPVEYWPHRIQMIKSMGFNALSVYVFWNYHEISKGLFDFQTDNRNLTHLLELAQIYSMQVLLRPGPYVCAEWDFGGMPARLLNIPGIKLRSSHPLFIEETKIYFSQLSQVIKPYIKKKNNPKGPILMIQVENQPSWVTQQKLYIDALKRLWDDIDIGCPLYFDDILDGYKNHTLFWSNAILAINAQLFDLEDYDRFNNSNHFMFSGEVYSGWFSSWGRLDWEKEWAQKYDKHFLQQFEDLLSVNASFSMYMSHGGTNFGLTAGYNLTTSYDYFSPINEQGLPTQKYHIFRSLILNYANKIPPKTPAPIQTMSAILGQTVAISSLFDNLPAPISLPNRQNPLVFESNELHMYNQGLVLYETTIKGPYEYVYDIIVHDFAIVYLDGEYKGTIVRTDKEPKLQHERKKFNIKCTNPSCKLEFLVQPLGHVNFGPQISLDRKGILSFVEKSSNRPAELTLKQWKHYKFDVSAQPVWKNNGKCTKAPCLYYVEANLLQAKDTYINLKGLKKGYVWVNGKNLGRYWDIGPQHSLYCPGVWLSKGKNKILILDFFVTNAQITMRSTDKPV